jgi:hypothetical protein
MESICWKAGWGGGEIEEWKFWLGFGFGYAEKMVLRP